MKLFSGTVSTLENALNYASLKQKTISQNIANVDTPDYKANDVSFKAAFQQAMSEPFSAHRTDARHFDFKAASSLNTAVTERIGVQYNHNGNSVDLDKEMSELATNQIYYNALTERINGKFGTLQSVIRGGK
ncbi:flagellar basal body rod protein FlgB [Bacillus sp. T33-2]|uniref:flagellar basal body rod protein FlgB n=1 Tax=Bacillus sp. T33-2 TaxID=2054168 RepID=UPI000C77EAEF|nr:flagellar basal body rod protein FlgB [Bacillus sp. T33-2]PLR97281.1 flagellar basal body rod protein FlgB [Bacillus sp. T33-2]